MSSYISHTRALLLLVTQLLVSRGPRVNSQGLGIANIGQVGNELEAIDNLTTSSRTSLDTEREDTTKSSLEVLLRNLMGLVALETWV